MRGWVLALVVPFVGLTTGCGGLGEPEDPAGLTEDGPEDVAEEETVWDAETTELEGALLSVAFGEGSLWVTDLGDYECDDTPGYDSSSRASSALCVSPDEVFVRRIDPETREVAATIPLKVAQAEVVAFGAASVWALSRDPNSASGPPGREVLLRIDPETDRVAGEILVSDPGDVAFGEGSLWVTSVKNGTLSRIDPGTGEVVAEVKISAGGASGVAVDERSGTVWATNRSSGPPESFVPPEDYERGVRSEPVEDAKLVRVDAETNQVVAEIPIEDTAIEGGASSVAVGEDAVWVTSVNGKLFRVDPATNEVVAQALLGDYSFDVEASENGIWSTSEINVRGSSASHTNRLTRVDPANNSVIGSVDIENVSGLALGAGAVWLTTGNVETGEGTLVRYAP